MLAKIEEARHALTEQHNRGDEMLRFTDEKMDSTNTLEFLNRILTPGYEMSDEDAVDFGKTVSRPPHNLSSAQGGIGRRIND